MSNRARPRPPSDRVEPAPTPGFWQRLRLFLGWFFAPRVFPSAWQRRPYLRSRNRRPGRSRRR